MVNDALNKHFPEAFFEFLSDPDGLTQEELRADLIELGIDTDKLEKRIRIIVKEGSSERRLAWLRKAKSKREEIEKKIEAAQASGKEMNKNLRDKIKEILEGRHGQVAFTHAEAYFRKVKDLSEKDLESLVDDLEKLNLLEELKEKNK